MKTRIYTNVNQWNQTYNKQTEMFGKKHLDINTQKHWRGTDKTVLKCKSFRLISYKWRQARCIKINPVGDNLRLRCHHHSAPTNKHLFSGIFLTELNINNNFRLIEKQAVLILKEKHVFWQKREPNICELWLRLIASLLQRNRRDYIYMHSAQFTLTMNALPATFAPSYLSWKS